MPEASSHSMTVLAYAIAAVLMLTHLFAGKLRFLDVTPRSIWLSTAGGVSVAYVFVHLLPELAEAQEHMARAMGSSGLLERHAYVMALVGLVAFYGLEKLALNHRGARSDRGGDDRVAGGLFWVHLGAFGLYNALIGYLLMHRETGGVTTMVWFGVAMALHFVVADFGLRDHYKHLYDRPGRFLLAGALALGVVAGRGAILRGAPGAPLPVWCAAGRRDCCVLLMTMSEKPVRCRRTNAL